MNKEVRKVKLISKNVLESVAYYSRFNQLYLTVFILKEKQTRESTTSCSKYSFKIADRTGEVTSKHFFEMVDKTDLI